MSKKSKPDFIEQFRAARISAAPLIEVRTYDNASATNRLIGVIPADLKVTLPILLWDCVNGVTGYNKVSIALAREIQSKEPLLHPVAALRAISKAVATADGGRTLPEDALVFMSNVHRTWQDVQTRQMLWNSRDLFAARGATLVMLTGPATSLPEGLTDDVVVMDDPLPTEPELREMISRRAELNDVKLDKAGIEKAVDALVGLPMFPAMQSTEMCFKNGKLDFDGLFERKRQIIEQTRASVWRGSERFADLGGWDNLKDYAARYIERKRPRLVMFLDEVQRAFAGHDTENTGIKSGFVKKFLTWMQDNNVDGILLIGPSGTGKSSFAKACGNEAECPTMSVELDKLQQKEVGSSEENLDRVLGIADAMAQGRLLVIATTNDLSKLPVELKRRFQKGTFYCDLPSEAAQEKAWQIHEKKYNVSGKRPNYQGWTGNEIEICCKTASEMGYTLIEASRYIVPVCRSGADVIRAMRIESTNKYIDAENPGIYEFNEQATSGRSAERKVRQLDADIMTKPGRS